MKIANSPRRLAGACRWAGCRGSSVRRPTFRTPSPRKVNRLVKIAVVFPQALLASTVTTANVTLKYGVTAVTGFVSYDAASKTILFRPAKALLSNTLYTVQLSTAVQLADTTPITLLSWTFTTRNTLQNKWYPGLTDRQ